jgi:hypothetical protein
MRVRDVRSMDRVVVYRPTTYERRDAARREGWVYPADDGGLWHNPYSPRGRGGRRGSTARYEDHVRSTLLGRIGELGGKVVVCECQHPRVSAKAYTRCAAEVLRDMYNDQRHLRATNGRWFLPLDVWYYHVLPYMAVESYKDVSRVSRGTRKALERCARYLEWLALAFYSYVDRLIARLPHVGEYAENPRARYYIYHGPLYLLYEPRWLRERRVGLLRARVTLVHELIPMYACYVHDPTPEQGRSVLDLFTLLVELYGARAVLVRSLVMVGRNRATFIDPVRFLSIEGIRELFEAHNHAFRDEYGEWKLCYWHGERRTTVVPYTPLTGSVLRELADLPEALLAH